MKRKLAAILCADAAGYSRLVGRDEAGTLAVLKVDLHLMRASIAKFGGRVVAVHGDSLLADFPSAVNAVQCAVEIQQAQKARNEGLPDEARMRFRIGINLGDVIEEEGDIYGDGVNIAARLEGLAEPGGICISRSIYEHVKGKLMAGYRSMGEHAVKNIAEPVRVYRVLSEPDETGETIGRIRYRMLPWRKAALGFAAALVLVGGILAIYPHGDRSGFSRETLARLAGKTVLPLPDKPSIAVLPLENMTGDPGQEYFADGFTEQIITSLSKIPALFVISRNSTFTYKGRPVKVRQAGEELGVRYVLEGSVQRFSGRIRINVQLIDAISARHVWAQSYDRSLQDLFRLQDEIVLKIASAMSANLTVGEQARGWAKGTKSLEAYLKLMQCRAYLFKGNRESAALARRLAKEAIALDPGYADAYDILGATYMNEVFLGTSRPGESIAKAVELTQKALSMNGSLAIARSRLGVLYSWSGRYDEGIAEAEQGVELDPNSATANYFLSMVLRYAGKSKEAIPVSRKALRLEPFAPDLYVQNLALVHFQAGDCREAVAACDKGLKRQPDNLNSRVIMAAVYGACGEEGEARREAEEILRINPKFTVESYTRVLPYKNPADRERTIRGLRKAGLP